MGSVSGAHLVVVVSVDSVLTVALNLPLRLTLQFNLSLTSTLFHLNNSKNVLQYSKKTMRSLYQTSSNSSIYLYFISCIVTFCPDVQSTSNIRATALGAPTSDFTVQELAAHSDKFAGGVNAALGNNCSP